MILGKYEIQEELGQGGFGTVYKALDRSLKRTVAVKVLHPNLVNDQTFLGRFRQEAQITAQLNHSNLVHIYDYGESEGHYYIVMSYMPCGSLKERIKNEGAFSKEAALVVIGQIAGGLEYSHKHHVIHRDLKPGNILFDEEGKACISDLGFAKLLRSDATASMSASGGIVGTPAYMAPEIWRGTAASPATDIYSLACILVEMLTGERLFGGESTPEVMLKHFEPLHLPESLPEEWKAVLEAALEKKPEDRIQSVGEFLEQLKQADLSLQKYTNQTHRADQAANPDYDSPEVGQILQRSLDSHPVEMVFESEKELRGKRGDESNDEVKATDDFAGTSTKTEPLKNEQEALDGGSLSSRSRKEESFRETENNENGSPSVKIEEKSKSQSGLILALTLLGVIIGVIFIIVWKSLTGPTSRTRIRPMDKMKQVSVPAGNFIMGSKSGDADAQDVEKPERTVYLDAYWIDKYEVSNGQYQECVENGACTIPHVSDSSTRSDYYGNPDYDNYPVVAVDWNQAKAYCKWVGGDLPTEAQWEKAARGEDGRKYPWGNQEPDKSYANYDWNFGYISKVGRYGKGASPYGAMDMAGNVAEWVNDDFAYYDANNTDNPNRDNINTKVVRGGSWNFHVMSIRVVFRLSYEPVSRNSHIGFRCVSKP